MDAYIGWVLQDITPWHWWALGVMLGGVEIIAPTTFFLFPAVTAGLMGLIVIVFPEMDWRLQLLIYAPLAIATTFGWRRWYRKHPIATDHPNLNDRMAAMKGKRATLVQPMLVGEAQAKLNDTTIWFVRAEDPISLPEGHPVEIIDVDQGTLIVRPLEPVEPVGKNGAADPA